MIAPRKVLIVGGGFIGTAAARALARRDHVVTVITRAPVPRALDSVEWVYGHLHSSHLAALLSDADVVIYAGGTIAPATELQSVATTICDELIPVVRLAENAAKAGARWFIFISSGGTVYGPTAHLPTPETAPLAPINTYGVLKLQTEFALLEVARRTDLAITIMRVSNPYGPGQIGTRQLGFVGAAIDAALSGTELTIWGDGSQSRDFVFIDDVGRAVAMAAEGERPSSILNIGSGLGTSLKQVCTIVTKVIGRPIATRFEEGRIVDVKSSLLDITRARQVLGWKPDVNLELGIERTAASRAEGLADHKQANQV